MHNLKNKTIFITGSSRGIGREIALRCARDGANVVITGKTVVPHPKLRGTIYSVAEEVQQAGGQALALPLDVRDEKAIEAAVDQTVARFGGVDVLVNNASAIALKSTLQTSASRLDLLWDVNMRATFLASKVCIPHLKNSTNPHILTLSPPLEMAAKWFAPHAAYSISKYGMSLCMLGMAREFAEEGVACNCLWPRTTIATAAIENNFPEAIFRGSRWPAIVADAAHAILVQDSRACTANFFIDEEVLRDAGMTDFSHYAVDAREKLVDDLFLNETAQEEI